MILNTRIKNKIDSFDNWTTANPILLEGEVVIVSTSEDIENTSETTLLIKVGDGIKAFNELPWLSAKASDVYNWAKASDVVLDGETIKFVGTNKEISLEPLGYLTETEVKTKITDAIAADVATNASTLAAEISDRETADTVLSNRLGAIEGSYVRFADDKLYVSKESIAEIIFDCGGADGSIDGTNISVANNEAGGQTAEIN